MDFRWVKPGVPVIAPAPVPSSPGAPREAPIVGVIVPPSTDITLRTVHSTWQGLSAGYVLTELLPQLGWTPTGIWRVLINGAVVGLLALARSWLSHRKQAMAR